MQELNVLESGAYLTGFSAPIFMLIQEKVMLSS
jgi:hypothetical protein